ncbi:MAG: acetyl-CoA carboxylase biotin carboxyl carrier protein [Candidatus Omnitrophica bacterium]|nr:acetyl-CoA carboxylase biotin carboxyl carrier protein [Candidatus Omnitrophota bacterium]
MNLKEIKEMIALMNENGLMELEIEKDGMRIKLRKASPEQQTVSGPIIVEREKVPEAKPKEELKLPVKESTVKTIEIKAPMVGTFYRAPSPEAPPFVEVGQVISAGDVICILEAMKLMNEIKSEVKGKVIEILVDNAEPVEFGQPLFLVEVI